MHACMHVRAHVCMYVCLYACVSECLHVSISVCLCLFVKHLDRVDGYATMKSMEVGLLTRPLATHLEISGAARAAHDRLASPV